MEHTHNGRRQEFFDRMYISVPKDRRRKQGIKKIQSRTIDSLGDILGIISKLDFVAVAGCIVGSAVTYDMRIDRNTVPEEKYQYEVAEDDYGEGDPIRVKSAILVNFLGTLICDKPLPIGTDGVLWLMDGDFVWL